MATRGAALALALGLLGGIVGAQSPERPGEVPDGLWQRLLAADAAAAQLQGFSAHFTQEKHTALLRRPLVSSGTVAALGGVVLWRTEEPAPSLLRVDGRDLRLLYPEDKLLEVYPLDARWAELVASPVPRLASLVERFRIEALPAEAAPSAPASSSGSLALRLTPRQNELARFVDRVDLALVPERGFAEWVEIVDPDGERTVIAFTEVRSGAAPEDVELDLEEGTEVRHPLGSGPSDR